MPKKKFQLASGSEILIRQVGSWHLGLHLDILWTDNKTASILEGRNLNQQDLNTLVYFAATVKIAGKKKLFQSKPIYHYFKIMSRSSLKLFSRTSSVSYRGFRWQKANKTKKKNQHKITFCDLKGSGNNTIYQQIKTSEVLVQKKTPTKTKTKPTQHHRQPSLCSRNKKTRACISHWVQTCILLCDCQVFFTFSLSALKSLIVQDSFNSAILLSFRSTASAQSFTPVSSLAFQYRSPLKSISSDLPYPTASNFLNMKYKLAMMAKQALGLHLLSFFILPVWHQPHLDIWQNYRFLLPSNK